MSETIYLRIKLSPKSSQNAILGHLDDEDQTLKVAVTAVPEKGKANAALIKLLSKEYKVAKSQIIILSGHTSRIKLIRIN